MLWFLEKAFLLLELLNDGERFDESADVAYRWARLRRWRRIERRRQLRAESADAHSKRKALKAAQRIERAEKAAEERRPGYLHHVFELERQKRDDRRIIEARPYEYANAMLTGEELHAKWRAGKTNISLAKRRT